MPKRIQRQRTKGWRMPEGAVYVGRPTRWGNPFVYRDESRGLVRFGPKHLERFGRAWDYEGRCSGPGASHDMWFSAEDIVKTDVRWATREEIVELFRLTLTDPTPGMRMAYPSRGGRFLKSTNHEIRIVLAGKDLVCWCPLDQPCHADVLLEIANTPDEATLCIRCLVKPYAGFCCSAHGKQLCHLCYRKTHFVEVCVAGCRECAAEGLPVLLSDYGKPEVSR